MGNTSSISAIPRATFQPQQDYLDLIELMATKGVSPVTIEQSREYCMNKYRGYTEVVDRFKMLTPRMARLLASSSSAFNQVPEYTRIT